MEWKIFETTYQVSSLFVKMWKIFTTNPNEMQLSLIAWWLGAVKTYVCAYEAAMGLWKLKTKN